MQSGGDVAKVARETLEKKTGEPVITPKTAIDFGRLISDVTKELPEKADEPNKVIKQMPISALKNNRGMLCVSFGDISLR